MGTPAKAAASLWAALLLPLLACHDLTPVDPNLGPDTTGPSIVVFLPTTDRYDANGDALIDVQLAWSDSSGAIDPTTANVRSLQGVNGAAPAGANLLDYWRVTQRDTAGLIFSETVENLLHSGVNSLEISVADTTGNLTVDTITLTLPHAQLVKTIKSGVSSNRWVNGMAVCRDDGRLYAALGSHVLVIDVDSLALLGVMRYPSGGNFQQPLCIPSHPDLYVSGFPTSRFDRNSWQVLPEPKDAYSSAGIAFSRANPSHVFVGEGDGSIGLIDISIHRRIGSVFPFTPDGNEGSYDIAVLPNDAKVYATRLVRTGILVFDPRTRQELSLIRIGGPAWPDYGVADDIELSADDRHLYAAVVDGDPRGVVEIDTRTDQVVRTLPLADYVPQSLGISPSGRRMWVSTRDRWQGVPSSNVLVDIATFQVIQLFERPRAGGEVRYDTSPAFHPNGKYIFVGHNLDVDVYLNRE